MINFNKFYKLFNIISIIFIVISILLLVFKGLNFGVDFKGGTLIELRTSDKQINTSVLRESFSKMNLGDLNVKKFGNENDYLVKIETSNSDNSNLIQSINDELSKSLGETVNFDTDPATTTNYTWDATNLQWNEV